MADAENWRSRTLKKLLAMLLAMTMVFTLFPVSALAEDGIAGESSAEEVTQIAEEPQPDPGEIPEKTADDPQEDPEETAEETPEPEGTTEETQEEVSEETPEESPEAEAEAYAASEEGTSAEDELIAAIADDSVNEYGVTGDCVLSSNLAIPAGFFLSVGEQGTLTVQKGITLTNNGTMVVDGGLVIESGAKLVNNEDFQARESAQVSMAGTFENTKWASAYAEGWNCTGTLVNNGGNFALFSDAATADELEAALKADGACVSVTADITLDRSITVTEGKQININPGVKLTVPASYTVTNNGSICVYGTLEINGTYSGERIVLVMSAGTLVPETIPHQKEGVLIEQITVLGPDTVQSGSSTWYSADILPANAWNAWLTWSIVSGSDLATITEYGELTAGDADGEVTIRATAADGSGVCGEKTVTIEGSGLTVEERLRNAIARGDSQFNITGDCVLSANLTVPANFNLFWNQGTLTIPDGVTLTIERSGYIAVSDMVIQSGGKIVNNGAISAGMSAKITVESGGTLENNLSVSVSSGGSFHNNGTYTPGARGNLYFDIGEGNLDTDLTGVDLKLVALTRSVKKEADIRALFAEAENVNSVVATLFESTAITLSDDLTIPENGDVTMDGNAVLTVPQGKTLTNNGSFTLCSNARLIVESGAKLVNNNNFYSFYSEDSVQISIAGTVENTGWVYVPVKSWNCTGTLVNNGYLDLFADVTTADEMETALRSADRVNVTADITLDRSITVPDEVQVDIESGVKLTVPTAYTITNNGSIFVYGTLEVSGTYEGGKVRVFQDAVLTPDSIPHQKQGMLAEQITITGADSVQPGSSTQYDVEILPDNAWETAVEWSIVSGKGLAEIDIYGNLTAGDTAGEITIRATAYDGSEVYGEKTVTIEGTTLTIDEQLRNAIASGASEYHITGDCALSNDLTIPEGFALYIDQGTFTIPEQAALSINGSVTVAADGTLENNWSIEVYGGGSIHNNGTYTRGTEKGYLYFDIGESNLETGLTGIDLKLVGLEWAVKTEADIRALFAKAEAVESVTASVMGASITLSDDLTIPENGGLDLIDGTLTVPQGKTLTNDGSIELFYGNSHLVIDSDAKLVNNGNFEASRGTEVSVAGTFENYGNGNIEVGSWNCTGTFEGIRAGITLYADVTTADELETAFKAGATSMTVTEDITLDRPITVPEDVVISIQPGVTLTVPAAYTLTGHRCWIHVFGTLDIQGTYSGEKIQVFQGGTLTPDSIPHKTEGVLAEKVTINGPDTVLPGGSASYSVEVFPDNVWGTSVEWSIVSGEDLASFVPSFSGEPVFRAGTSTGTFVIRATAADGSDVSAEKTVTIEGTALSIEEQLRAAIANGESEFRITGDCELSGELTIPAGFHLCIEQGTLTIREGVYVYVEGGSITIEDGGTLENNWVISVSEGGSFHNNGTYTPGETSDLIFDMSEIDLDTGLTGVDMKLVRLTTRTETEADIRALFAKIGTVKGVTARVEEASITLSDDLTIPTEGFLQIGDNGVLTVPQGKTLTNNSTINMYSNGRLVIEPGATLVNNDTFLAWEGTQVSVAGTFENNGRVTTVVGGWNCTGTLVNDAGDFTVRADVTTAEELEAALKAGATSVTVTENITLDRSITVSENTELNIRSGIKMVVPEAHTLTNNGTILVDGTLEINGTFSGEKIHVYYGGTLTPDTIPHRNAGVTATAITIIGADTVPTGGSTQYSASLFPEDVWETWVRWSIVSGGDLAAITSDGVLTAGDTTGTVTIRADAVDGSLIYAEKTVTIGEAALTIEDELRAAIESGKSEFTITGDCTLTRNLDLPDYFVLRQEEGTLTVAQGATLTNNGEIRIWRASSSLVIASGARIVNNNSFVVENGAQVSMAGTFENTGRANIRAAGWSCTGELVNSGTFLLFFEVATADELEAMLRSGVGYANANVVVTTADITLDRSITVPGNMQLNIDFGTKLTVPAPYTLTNEGSITVAGMLEVTGTFSGNPVDLLDCGTLIPEDIPHRDRVVPVTEITITGADTLSPGSHTRYSAETLPLEATDGRVEWSIISGGDLATMLDDGILLAGASTGEVTIHATAMDGTGVYGEKTVKIEGDYVPCEEQLRTAIKNNEEMFEIYGDCTLSADLTVPAGFRLYVQYGTLTVPNGVTLTVAQDGCFYSCSNVVAQSGGKIINNGILGAFSNGDITVEAGGTLENNWIFSLYYGGTLHNYGTYTPGEESDLYFSDGNYKTDVTGVDWKLLTVESLVQTEEELRTLLENSVNVKQLTARLYGTTAITLSDDLTIPETGCIMLAGESSLTVPAGKTLTNNGNVHMIENARLVIESGAALINNDYIGSTEDTEVSVAGTLESTGWGYVHIDSWHCTGTFVNGGQGIALFEWAATEEELEAALQSGANTVEITADITLGSSAAVPEVQFYSLASVYADTSAANGSLVIPEGVNLVIKENVELTIPAEYMLTCLGQISVLGTLNVSGTYSGGQVLVYESGTVTSEEEIPQQNEGVPVKNITVTGEDTILPGGSAQYIAEILPENAWVQQVKWSITAGKELAEIDADGNLFADGTTGTVTIRAAATDGSAVYGEKTVTIEGASIEEQLRAAIENGDSQFDIAGSFTLSDDLTIPAGFNLYVDRGTLTIPNGVTLTIDQEGFFGSCTNTVVQSGGKIVNNGTINSYMGGSITVEAGGTLENNWDFFVFYEGSFHNYGAYTSGTDGDLYFDINGSDLDTDLTGVDRKLVTLETRTETEADIRALFAMADTVKSVRGAVADTSITLSDDLTIPAGCYLHIAKDGVLTVPQGKTLTNNGGISMYSNGRLVIESGAALVNNNDFSAWEDTQISMAGTFENNGGASATVGGWNCTGKLVDNNQAFTLSAEAATAAELEAAIKAGATFVSVTEDITLDRSITIPENVELYIDVNGKLTVPSPYTLTNNGSIYVAGTLDVSGTYKGEKVMVYYDGTVTGENIPQRNEGVPAAEIKITGATTVSVGGTAQYTAKILPENAWVTWADWSIVSGGELAEISPGGYLEARNTPGEITIRADAADGSLVYAELTVTITDRIPGDVTGDGEVDVFDCVRLKRYIAGFDVTINEANADVNGDGEIDIFDCVRLQRYLAGFAVELK